MMKTKRTFIYYILLVLGVLVLINIIADKLFVRLDFTEDSRYTLSKATKDILRALPEPVTVTAYFSENLPAEIEKARRDFKELLVEYASLSKGMVVYEFINPNEDEQNEKKAAQAGIQPVMINSREKDQVVQKKAFLGAVVQLGEQSDIIPLIRPGDAMEYVLSSSIKKISVEEKPIIGFLQGHGEPSMSACQQVLDALNVLYQIEPVTLNDTVNSLDKYKTVIVLAPKDSFPESHLRQLEDFLAKGKNLFIACNRVEGDFSTAMGNSVNTGLETWLSNKGITIENNFIIDSRCGTVQVQQQQGPFSFMTSINFPYLPVISNFSKHPITEGLEAAILQFASSITFTGDSTITFTPIAKSSDRAGTQSVPLYFNIQKQWSQEDFPLSNLTVGAVVEGKLAGNARSRMVVISDGDFPINGEGNSARQIQPDNANLMVNSVDWLSDDTGLISLRTQGVTSRPLDQLEEGKKRVLKIINFLLPIILIIGYGIFRMQHNRNIRIKRMEEGYV